MKKKLKNTISGPDIYALFAYDLACFFFFPMNSYKEITIPYLNLFWERK